jgi:SAM-dependent methyltransferase
LDGSPPSVFIARSYGTRRVRRAAGRAAYLWGMRVDYDRRQHAVYSRGREPTPKLLELWARVLGRYVAAGSSVLDVGSGTGIWSQLLAEVLEAEVVGVEPSDRMRAVAAHEHAHPRVRYVAGSAERVPLSDGACDVALLSHVLHHVEDRAACVAQLARVLRPGGLVLVRGSLRDSLDSVPWLAFFPPARPLAERQLPAAAQVVEAFARAGFERVASEVVRQELGASLRAHYERVRLRAISTLELLDDADFEAGIAAMRAAAEREDPPRPVFEDVDLLVFRAQPRAARGRQPAGAP